MASLFDGTWRAWRWRAPLAHVCLASSLLVALQGCATTSWYFQSMRGHLALMGSQRPMDIALADPRVPAEVRARLAEVPGLMEFAQRELDLPARGNYTNFVMLARPFVAWNVFAAPELSLEPRQWCYPVAGCLSYRGFYSEQEARTEAAKLADQGDDTTVAGVVAYSTLGWFDDPVTSAMLRGSRFDIAALLFHELAHGRVWVPGETALNEAFAEAVARIGVERLAASAGSAPPEEYLERRAVQDRQHEILMAYRSRLQYVYDSAVPVSRKRALKHELMASLQRELAAASAGGKDLLDWFGGAPNNAHLAAMSTYRERVPAFMALYEKSCRDLATFYTAVQGLADVAPGQRDAWLHAVTTTDRCGDGPSHPPEKSN